MFVKALIFVAGGGVVWWFQYMNLNETHSLWKIAYAAGYANATEFYEGLLEIERSDSVVDAKCLFRNFEWKELNNRGE